MLILPVRAADKEKDEDTLRSANLVLQDMLNSKDISPTELSQAFCVLILPGVKKVGVGIGGRGALALPHWPELRGQVVHACDVFGRRMSVGLQVGGSSSDFVLLLMTAKVVDQVLNGKTEMGTDATAAAGPGATAASASDADILTQQISTCEALGVCSHSTVESDSKHRNQGLTFT